MFPQSNYNTPHGHQFGRAEAAFANDGEINPRVWAETRSEQTFIPTYEEQEAVPYAQPTEIVEQHRVEANRAATSPEQNNPAERTAYVEYAHGLTANIRAIRDYELAGKDSKSDWSLAA